MCRWFGVLPLRLRAAKLFGSQEGSLITALLAFSVCLALIVPANLSAQANRGNIQGQVQDIQTAILPGARITLTDVATSLTLETTSGQSGEFSFLNLSAGTYTLSCEVKGFRKFVQEHVSVDVGRTSAITISLQPGEIQQTITVTADAAMVDRETSDVGTAVTQEQIKDLPVPLTGDSRNPLSFVELTPGVNGSVPGATPDYRLHISGSPSYSSEVYIDGIPIVNTNLVGDISQNHPPIDAIGEFKITNNNESAQYGFTSGAISFTFRSGTNDFHGSLFEYLQNSALNATDYVTNALGEAKAPLKQNEFGFTLGGPVWIPKLYKGKDHTFFFTNFTEFKYRPSSNNAALSTIPNAYRQGDFSSALGPQLLAPNPLNPSQQLPVFDAAGQPVNAGEIYNPNSSRTVTGPDGHSYTVRDALAGNILPASLFSSASRSVLQSFPMANSNAALDNFFRNQSQKIDEDRFVGKIDQNFNEKHTLSGSFFRGNYTNLNNGTLNLTDATTTSTPTLQTRVSYNYTHSATLVNNLNIGFLRDTGFTGPTSPGPGLATLGISGVPTGPQYPYPSIQIQNFNGIGSETLATDAENRFVENDNLVIIRGPHTLRTGVEVRRLQRNEASIGANRFTFVPTETAQNGTGFVNTPQGPKAVSIPTGTGNSVASFLFGAVDFSRIDIESTTAGYRWFQAGTYFQDDWKVSSDLTLNLGLRYDVQVPRTEVKGRVSTLDPTLPNPAAGGVLGAYTFYGNGPGRNGQPRIGNIDYLGLQPRVGFAYSPGPDHKTAFRGGFSINRPLDNDNIEGGIGGTLYTTGFNGLATASAPGDAAGSPAFYWDRGYPAANVALANLNPGQLVGNDNPALIYPKSGMPPTQLNWSFQVQRSLPGSMLASVAYVGMHTYHLGLWSKPNQVNPAVAHQYSAVAAKNGLPLNQFLALPITDPRAVAAGITAPFPTFLSVFGSGATVGQTLRPYPQYGDVDNPLNPIGSVSYNALQSSLQKRFSHGLTFLLSYTFQKTIGDVDSNAGAFAGGENAQYAGSFFQDYYNTRSQRAVTSSDIPQVLAISYSYELPIGPGKPFLNKGGLTGKLVGGWEVTGIQQYQRGRPIHIEYDAFGTNNPYYANDGFSFRPDVVPGQPLKNPAYNASCSGPVPQTAGRSSCAFYINPAAFAIPASGQFGNAGNLLPTLRLPNYYNEDLSISKRTAIAEHVNLQFQANFFNAFNRVVFGSSNPVTYIINQAPGNLSSSTLATSSSIFGLLASQQNAPRRIQLSLKLEF